MSDESPFDKPKDQPLSRFCMVESQLRACGVQDVKVLAQFRTLAREKFVPAMLAGAAYVDEDIQISTGRYLMEPLVMARMIEAAKISLKDRVLDLAPASGFSTIILAGLAREVTALEPDEMVHLLLTSNVKAHKLTNVKIMPPTTEPFARLGGPHDVIFVNGSVGEVPSALFDALEDKGRLVVAVYSDDIERGEVRVYRKFNKEISSQTMFEANVKPFPAVTKKPVFVF